MFLIVKILANFKENTVAKNMVFSRIFKKNFTIGCKMQTAQGFKGQKIFNPDFGVWRYGSKSDSSSWNTISGLFKKKFQLVGGDILNYFPNGDEEINLIKFISKYQYLNVNDSKYFFSSKKYYKQRISNLVNKKMLRRIKLNLVLDELGIEYSKMFQFEYNKLNRDKKYLSRLLYLSNLGAFYNNCNTVKFIPSFDMKDKAQFTITARRFVGILDISGIEYLTYYISEEHNEKYLKSVIYDIQKERNYKNIIILVNDKNRIKINDFTFGANQVLILEDTEENREELKYLNSIDWYNVVKKIYKNDKIYLSDYNFCEYTNYKNKYISTFYFLDTEKINRIKYFLRENKNKNADIICSAKLKAELIKELPNCNYIVIDLEEYIDKEIFVYD